MRATTYPHLVIDAIDPNEIATIRLNLQRQQALRDVCFRTAIERQLGRRAGPAARMGKPKAKAETAP
ncbi:hypothetical protein [Pseudoxanthomonas winnipegensis]|uniref:Uncharacterized protein n=1 Tax=Pseudoxanthomonas winnipegensis TaxID=2480810 RepID=A0A4Q8L6B0_9GAMM|nr:hypothetical protein [Pseudoxanthomonas winnipegensis]TAA23295.1 hypothetical protein EA660_15265 [Pseudoxanthomonas winnipegensis]